MADLRQAARRVWDSPTMMTWASLGTNAARFLVVLPLVLRSFSVEDVAVWYLFSTLLQFQSYLDFGFGDTVSRYFAYAMGGAHDLQDPSQGTGHPNHMLLGRIYRTMRAIVLPLGLGAGVIVGLVGLLLLRRPISLSSDPTAAWQAWGVVVVGSTLGFCRILYSSYLAGTNRIALARRWDALMNVGAIVSSCTVLLLGGRLLALAVAGQAWGVVLFLRDRALARRAEPEAFEHARGSVEDGMLSIIWSRAWKSGVGVLLNSGVVRISAALVAQFVAPATMAAYLVAFNVLDRVNQFSQAPFYSKLPRFAALYSSGQIDEMTRISRRAMAMTMGIFAAGALVLGFLAVPLLRLVESQTAFIGLGFWFLLAAGLLIHRYGAMHLQLYTLSNDVVWHIADGVSGPIFLVTWIATIAWIGIYAVPLAFIVAYGGFYTTYSVAKYRAWQRRLRPSPARGAAA